MNEKLLKCPRCGKTNCGHDEKIWGDILATLGTGVTNLDLVDRDPSYQWAGSLGKFKRIVFVELKRQFEPLRDGQRICLMDLTGTIINCEGFKFESRSFIAERAKDQFRLLTFLKSTPGLALTLVRIGTAAECCKIINAWFSDGTTPKPVSEDTGKSYVFLDVDECRYMGHVSSFHLGGSHATPMRANLICGTCSDKYGKTAYVAFGEEKTSFGTWNNSRPGKETEQFTEEV